MSSPKPDSVALTGLILYDDRNRMMQNAARIIFDL